MDKKRTKRNRIYAWIHSCRKISVYADYWKDLAEADDTFIRPKLTPVTLKFDPWLKKIKFLARKRGISYNAYVRYLPAKSVEEEIPHKSTR